MIEQPELTWYITRGISCFERSTSGAILERCEMQAFVSFRCLKCNGLGLLPNVAWYMTETYHGEPINPPRLINGGKTCPRCNGTGAQPMRLSPEEQKLVDSGDWASSGDHAGQRSSVPDEVLCRYASVSRTLNRMRRVRKEALMMAFGDEGEELASTSHGRAWACSPLTASGAELLRQERERRVRVEGIEPERPIQCMVALANLSGHKSHPERVKLLAQAAKEAISLLADSIAEWDAILESAERRAG
jgi:hypothetical protein